MAVASPGPFGRATRWVEYASGAVLALITLLAFAAVLMRYFLAKNIPDAIEVGGLLMAVSIFLGMALACLRGEHITVDLLWAALPARGRLLLDLFAGLVTLVAVACFAWMLARQVHNTWRDGLLTYDLQIPVWPFYAASASAVIAAAVLQGLHLARRLQSDGQAPGTDASSPEQRHE